MPRPHRQALHGPEGALTIAQKLVAEPLINDSGPDDKLHGLYVQAHNASP